METKNFYDGLSIKTNDYHKTANSDCDLCCFANSDAECEDCPLKRGFYFAEPSSNCSQSSAMSEDDKEKLKSIIGDLSWLAKSLDVSLRLGIVFDSTIFMAKSSLDRNLFELGLISTFDK